MQSEFNIALESWGMWHLALVTFAFCGFTLKAAGKVKSQQFCLHGVQFSWHAQQDVCGGGITCRMHLINNNRCKLFV